jgi:hypothetical protein
VERAGEGLIVRPLSNEAVWSDRAAQLKAIDAFLERLPADLGFSEAEEEALRADAAAADQRETAQILAGFVDGDLPA